MESEVKTVVCPNCGASAHNLHNCEFCGSFLVQRAAEGKDVSSYVYKTEMISNEGLTKSVKRFADLFQSLPVEATYGLVMDIDSNGKKIQLVPTSIYQKNSCGFCYFILVKKGAYNDEFLAFKKSNVFDICAMEEHPVVDMDGNYVYTDIHYFLDFGYDYSGAAKVVQQLFDVFGMDINSFESKIWLDGPDNYIESEHEFAYSSISADKNGDIVACEGDGINMFRNVGKAYVEERAATKQQNDNNDSVEWKKWLFWIAVGIGCSLLRLLF